MSDRLPPRLGWPVIHPITGQEGYVRRIDHEQNQIDAVWPDESTLTFTAAQWGRVVRSPAQVYLVIPGTPDYKVVDGYTGEPVPEDAA